MNSDEKKFTREFLDSCTDLDLVLLQHDLRKFDEDKPYFNQVIEEMKNRIKKYRYQKT